MHPRPARSWFPVRGGALGLCVGALLSTPAAADDAGAARDREIADLRARVAALEQQPGQGGAAASSTPANEGGTAGDRSVGTAAPAPAERAWYQRIQLGALVDVYYAYNANEPGNGDTEESFIPGTGSSAKRADQIDLNLAAIDIRLEPEPIGFHLALAYGTGTQVLHVGEPDGDADLGEVSAYDLIYRAAVEAELPIGPGVRLEVGIFPSPIGFEGFYSRDNFHYTRSYLGELSPYYLCGVQASAELTASLSAKAFVVNGWQVISENNRAKGFGGQLAFSSGAFSVAATGFAGPELADDVRSWRLFGDLVAKLAPMDGLEIAVQADLGYQELPALDDAVWHAYAGFVRVTPLDWLAVSARAELFRDPRNGISGFDETLWALTGTLELKPVDGISVKLEARYDRSDVEVFADRDTDVADAGTRERDELLFLVGVVAWF